MSSLISQIWSSMSDPTSQTPSICRNCPWLLPSIILVTSHLLLHLTTRVPLIQGHHGHKKVVCFQVVRVGGLGLEKTSTAGQELPARGISLHIPPVHWNVWICAAAKSSAPTGFGLLVFFLQFCTLRNKMPPPPHPLTVSEQKQVWHHAESGRWALDCMLLYGNDDNTYTTDDENCIAGLCDFDGDAYLHVYRCNV